jgi:hypothetical protein
MRPRPETAPFRFDRRAEQGDLGGAHMRQRVAFVCLALSVLAAAGAGSSVPVRADEGPQIESAPRPVPQQQAPPLPQPQPIPVHERTACNQACSGDERGCLRQENGCRCSESFATERACGNCAFPRNCEACGGKACGDERDKDCGPRRAPGRRSGGRGASSRRRFSPSNLSALRGAQPPPRRISVSKGQRRLGQKEYRAPSVTPGLHFASELRLDSCGNVASGVSRE